MIPTYVRNDYYTGDSLNKNLKKSGSREHYYHFLIGYLLPIIKEQNLLKLEKFNVLDCGPIMTPHLEKVLLALKYKFEIIQKEKISNPIYVDKWDSGQIIDLKLFYKTLDLVKYALKNEKVLCCDCITSKNLILKRSKSPSYYLKNGHSEILSYGVDRRSIINLDEVCGILKQAKIMFKLYEPGLHNLNCQIKIFSQSEAVTGIRGAEFANIVFSHINIRVRMLNHLEKGGILPKIFKILNINYELIQVNSAQCEDDSLQVLNFFNNSI